MPALILLLLFLLSACAYPAMDMVWYETYQEFKGVKDSCLPFAEMLQQRLKEHGIEAKIKVMTYKWERHAYVQVGDQCTDNGYISPMGWFPCVEIQ